jgi:hypothetical protein
MRALTIHSAVIGVIVAAVGSLTVGCTDAAAPLQQQATQPGSAGAASARDHSCPQPQIPSIRPMRWGYYPGYGCGPIPPAEIHFS